MDERRRFVAASAVVVGIFVVVQVGALAIARPFVETGVQPVENPDDPVNSLGYFLALLGATGLMLLAIRYGVEWLIRGFVVLAAGLLSWVVLSVFLPPVAVGGSEIPPDLPALAVALALALALIVHPEWYVVDVVGILMGAGTAGFFGIAFGVLPTVLLLVALAVYDAISVYRTGHMLTLAEGAAGMRVPVLFVVPTRLPYSFVEATRPLAEGDDDERDPEVGGEADPGERSEPRVEADPGEGTEIGIESDPGPETETGPNPAEAGSETETGPETDLGAEAPGALFVGLGDAVFPAVLVVSAVVHGGASTRFAVGVVATVPALAAASGSLVGLAALMALVGRGKPHAGLPLLNGGAIGGYLLGALAVGIGPVEALGLMPYL